MKIFVTQEDIEILVLVLKTIKLGYIFTKERLSLFFYGSKHLFTRKSDLNKK